MFATLHAMTIPSMVMSRTSRVLNFMSRLYNRLR